MDAVFLADTLGAKLLMNALEYGRHIANHWTQDTNSCTNYYDDPGRVLTLIPR